MAVNIKEFSTQIFELHTELSKVWRKYAAKSGIYAGQERIIFTLIENNGRHNGCTLNELSNLTGIGISSLSVSISNMEKSGDIEKITDPKDKRIFRIYTTAHGLKNFDKFTKAVDTLFSSFMDKYTSEKMDSEQFLNSIKFLADFVRDEGIL